MLKKWMYAAVLSGIAATGSAFAEVGTGLVTLIQVPMNSDTSVYFKLDPMPQEITGWFYFRNGTGSAAGCAVSGNEKSTDRAYAALLTAQASSKSVTVHYCLDSNGYGLVNGFVRINPL